MYVNSLGISTSFCKIRLLAWCECVRCVCLIVRACLTVTPWAVAGRDPLSMEFLRQKYWSGLRSPPAGRDLSDSGYLPSPGIPTTVSCILCIAGEFFTAEPLRITVQQILRLQKHLEKAV